MPAYEKLVLLINKQEDPVLIKDELRKIFND